MTRLCGAALTLLLHSSLTAVSQQPATASIEGTVRHAVTGEPLPGVKVSLMFIPPPAPRPALSGGGGVNVIVDRFGGGLPSPITSSAPANVTGLPQLVPTAPAIVTDNAGSYSYRNLEPGSYRIAFSANGYVPTEYGTLTALNRPINNLVLSPGQTMTGISAKMVPTGNISGRVQSLAGSPLPGVPVNLYRAEYLQAGERTLQSAASVRTNDRGEYRIFWIAPGRYYLIAGGSAVARQTSGAFNNESADNYSFAFYPSAKDIDEASTIEVLPGSDQLGLNFAVGVEQLYRVRGTLVDSRTGQPPANGGVSVSKREVTGNRGYGGRTYYDAATGAFEVTDLVPGNYTLQSQIADRPPAGAPVPIPQVTLVATATVRIVNANVEGIQLELGLGQTTSGKVETDGGSLPANARVQVRFIPTVQAQGLTVIATSEADGTISVPGSTFRNGPGDFRVTAGNNLPAGWYLKEARLGDMDVMSTPAHFPSSLPLTLIVSNRAGQIDGVLRNDQQQPVPATYVVLVPNTPGARGNLTQQQMTDQSGRYTIRNAPPGDYKLFSWEAMVSGAWFDPDWLKNWDAKGIPVTVGESSRQTVNLTTLQAGGAR